MNIILELLHIKHNIFDMKSFSKEEIDFMLDYYFKS